MTHINIDVDVEEMVQDKRGLATYGQIKDDGTGKKSVETVTKEVLAGKWGNGEDRKKRLQATGYDYGVVQAKVNELVKGSGKKSVEAVAKEVIAGKWGNGEDRKKKLQAAGYDYGAVQRKVNELMR